MCGIVMGIIKATATRGDCRLARRDLHRAMAAMDSRGGDSWGVAVGPESCRIALRGLGPYSKGGNLPLLNAGDVLVGHTRFATKGAVTLQNAHPFSHGDWSVAHNGAFREHIPADEWQDCDSYRLTGEIARSLESGTDASLDSGGYGTVVATDGEHAFVWRSSGQAHVVVRPWGTLVTSVPVEGMTGRVVHIPDDETIQHITAEGNTYPWSKVSLAPSWAPFSAAEHAWTWDGLLRDMPANKQPSKARKGASSAAWETCLGCGETAPDCMSGVCRDCVARWGNV